MSWLTDIFSSSAIVDSVGTAIDKFYMAVLGALGAGFGGWEHQEVIYGAMQVVVLTSSAFIQYNI